MNEVEDIFCPLTTFSARQEKVAADQKKVSVKQQICFVWQQNAAAWLSPSVARQQGVIVRQEFFAVNRQKIYAWQYPSYADCKPHSAKNENDDGKKKMTGGCQKKADTDQQARIMPVVNIFYWRNWNDAECRISPAEYRRRYVLQQMRIITKKNSGENKRLLQ